MSSLASLLMVVLAACVVMQVSCRPRTPEAPAVEVVDGDGNVVSHQPIPSEQYGYIVGDLQVWSHDIDISRPRPKKKKPSGPRASALISGPAETSLNVGPGTAVGAELAIGSSPAVAVSGATLTFNTPAQVVPVVGP
ncbi:uncharacterized protein LOC121871835 [Homarus americanus]|nr:uncharacterized protein LOC121871835 [Homarus americanus]